MFARWQIYNFNPRLREGGDALLTAAFPTSYISIHASAREATTRTFMTLIMQEFQSTPPRGRRPDIAIDKYYFVNFNPRLREGGDRCNAASGIQSDYFNPRLREGGDAKLNYLLKLLNDFNPRLREGGDVMYHSEHQTY